MNQGYQPSIANQGFQPELPKNNRGSGSSSLVEKLVKGVLIIGGIIFLIPVVLFVVCLVIVYGSSIFNALPLLDFMGTGTILLTGITLMNNKKISKKYLPLLLFAMTFSILFLAGQYNVQSFNCPLHTNYQLFMPIIQLFASMVGLVGFCFNGIIPINKKGE
ncbi:hypothetical protein CL617_01015 [archaeon]|nr:hypothetical protein [archaeon]|tara:strand:+ start:5251 stop:5736 length:486 start_codon:yes stop_codon:yes gene_type:complete